MEHQRGSYSSASTRWFLGLSGGPGAGLALGRPSHSHPQPGLMAPSPGLPGASPRPGSLANSGLLGSSGSSSLPLRSLGRYSLSPSWGSAPDDAAAAATAATGLYGAASAAAVSPDVQSTSEWAPNHEEALEAGRSSNSCVIGGGPKLGCCHSADTQPPISDMLPRSSALTTGARLGSLRMDGRSHLSGDTLMKPTWLQRQKSRQNPPRLREAEPTAGLPGLARGLAALNDGKPESPPVQIQWLPPVAPEPDLAARKLQSTQRNRPVKQVQWLLPEKELEKERKEEAAAQERASKGLALYDGAVQGQQPPPKRQRRELSEPAEMSARRLGGLRQPAEVMALAPPQALPCNVTLTGLRPSQPHTRPQQQRTMSLMPVTRQSGNKAAGTTAKGATGIAVPELSTLTAAQWASLEHHLLGDRGDSAVDVYRALNMLSMYSFTAPSDAPAQQRHQQQATEDRQSLLLQQQQQHEAGRSVANGNGSDVDTAAAAATPAGLNAQPGGYVPSTKATPAGRTWRELNHMRQGCFDPGYDIGPGRNANVEIQQQALRTTLSTVPYGDLQTAMRAHPDTVPALWGLVATALELINHWKGDSLSSCTNDPSSPLRAALATREGGLSRPATAMIANLAVECSGLDKDTERFDGGAVTVAVAVVEAAIAPGCILGGGGRSTITMDQESCPHEQQHGRGGDIGAGGAAAAEAAVTAEQPQQRLSFGVGAANVLRNLAVAELVPEQLLCSAGLEICACALQVYLKCIDEHGPSLCDADSRANASAIQHIAASLIELLTVLPHKLRLPEPELRPPDLREAATAVENPPTAAAAAAVSLVVPTVTPGESAMSCSVGASAPGKKHLFGDSSWERLSSSFPNSVCGLETALGTAAAVEAEAEGEGEGGNGHDGGPLDRRGQQKQDQKAEGWRPAVLVRAPQAEQTETTPRELNPTARGHNRIQVQQLLRRQVQWRQPPALLRVVMQLMGGGAGVQLRLQTLAAGLIAAWLTVPANRPAILHELSPKPNPTPLSRKPSRTRRLLTDGYGAAGIASDERAPDGPPSGEVPGLGKGREGGSPPVDMVSLVGMEVYGVADGSAAGNSSTVMAVRKGPRRTTMTWALPMKGLQTLLSLRAAEAEVEARREVAEVEGSGGVASRSMAEVETLGLLAAWRRSDAVAAAVEILHTLTFSCGPRGRELVRAHRSLLSDLAAVARAGPLREEAASTESPRQYDDPLAARCRAVLTAASEVASEVLSVFAAEEEGGGERDKGGGQGGGRRGDDCDDGASAGALAQDQSVTPAA